MGRHYPPPMHQTIVEPFCGAAGYSIHWWDRDVVLVDLDENISDVWRYLIGASPADVRALPLVEDGARIDRLPVCPGAKKLIGFWSGQGVAVPRATPSQWPNEQDGSQNSGWSAPTREHVATVARRVSHWTIIEGDYTEAPDLEATWFVDPPYQSKGYKYRRGSSGIDYQALAEWCRGLRGQVMVCEQLGAEWLPFQRFRSNRGIQNRATEVVWYNMDNPWPQKRLEV